MNRIKHTFGFASLATTLLLAACAKEQPTIDPDDASRFTVFVEEPVESNGSKIYYNSSTTNNSFYFQDNDKIWINGAICTWNNGTLKGTVGQVPRNQFYGALSDGFYRDNTRFTVEGNSPSTLKIKVYNVEYPSVITREKVRTSANRLVPKINAPLVAQTLTSSNSTELQFKHAAAYIDVRLDNRINSETGSAWYIDSIVVSSNGAPLCGRMTLSIDLLDGSITGCTPSRPNGQTVSLHLGAQAADERYYIPVCPALGFIYVSVYARASNSASETTVITQRTTSMVRLLPGKCYKASMNLNMGGDINIGPNNYGDGGELW